MATVAAVLGGFRVSSRVWGVRVQGWSPPFPFIQEIPVQETPPSTLNPKPARDW